MKKPVKNRFTEEWLIEEWETIDTKEASARYGKQLEAQLEKLKTPYEKMDYLNACERKYLNEIPAHHKVVSGMTIAKGIFTQGSKFWKHEIIDRYKGLIQLEINKLEKLKGKKDKHNKAKALFCSLVHQLDIDIQGRESIAAYCKRICEKFKLEHTGNERKSYSQTLSITEKKNSKALKELREHILPNIDKHTAKKIQDFIDHKTKTFR